MLEESQKIALITGSAVRVGKYITELLAKDGWKIALHYNSSEKEAYNLANKLIDYTDVMLFKADLSFPAIGINLIEQINLSLGKVNLIINNASVYENDNISNLMQSSLEKNFNIHCSSPIFLAQAMLKQGIEEGNIINIIDTDVTKNMKKFFSYSLSKKALFNLTQMLALSLSPGIRVNAIAPGAILFKEGQNKQLFDKFIEESPLKIKPKLSELYNTIQFLINNKSITGQCIFLDGGRHLNIDS